MSIEMDERRMERLPKKRGRKSNESNTRAARAFMGSRCLMHQFEFRLRRKCPEKTKQIILLCVLDDGVRPNGEEQDVFRRDASGRDVEAGIEFTRWVKPWDGKRKPMAVDVLLGTPTRTFTGIRATADFLSRFRRIRSFASKMAPEFSKGVQDQGMVADVKHFAANNQETLRQGVNEHISERALREIYLPGFEAAVKKERWGRS